VPVRPCLNCGRLAPAGQSYCPTHADLARGSTNRWNPDRGTSTEQTAWRASVLARAGIRCEAVEAGKRCIVRGAEKLEAHHVVPVREDPNLALVVTNGVALCVKHHRAVEVQLRRRVRASS
jgi:5-methylcytosine-specific restriction endonuclease McrA